MTVVRAIQALSVYALELLALIIPAWAFRYALITKGELQHYDWLGTQSDVAAACILYAPLLLLSHAWRRRIGYLVVGIYTILLYGNYEVIQVLDGNLELGYLQYAVHESFIKGSLFAIQRPILLVVVAIVSQLLWFAAEYVRTRYCRNHRLGYGKRTLLAVYCMCAFVLSCKFYTYMNYPRWRQYSLLVENVQPVVLPMFSEVFIKFAKKGDIEAKHSASKESIAQANSLRIPDLEGRSLLTDSRILRPNIILLSIESLSAELTHEEFQDDGTTVEGPMPKLRHLAKKGLSARNAIAGNRATIRGQYSLYCGDYPQLSTKGAKFATLSEQQIENLNCLPKILTSLGYATHYIQSAIISFMNKQTYLRAAGFESVRGANSFEEFVSWGSWGIDDKTLLDEVFKVALSHNTSNQEKPFFVAALNVGTHHPYFTPKGFSSRFARGSRANAAAYLDTLLQDFYQRLQSSGLAENTLLIITADEGYKPHALSDLASTIQGSWIPIIVLGPGVPSVSVHAPYAQSDLAVSILDYLDIQPPTDSIIHGRSLFRRYQSERYVPFAYSGEALVTLATPEKKMLHCDVQFTSCMTTEYDRDLFTTDFERTVPTSPSDISLLQGILYVNNLDEVTSPFERRELIAAGTQSLPKSSLKAFPLSRTFLGNLNPGDSFRLLANFTILEGTMILSGQALDVVQGEIIHTFKSKALSAGDTFQLDDLIEIDETRMAIEVSISALNVNANTPVRFTAENTELKITRIAVSDPSSDTTQKSTPN